MRVLAFGSYDVAAHPRVAVLIEGLRAAGDDVVEVNLPLGLDTAARVAMLHRPWRLPLLAARLLRCWTTLAVRGRRAARAHRPQAVLVGYLGHFDVLLARRLFRGVPIALDHLVFAADTAADRGAGGGWRRGALRRLDAAALRSADVVVLDTAEHAAMLPPDLAGRAVVVPLGASAAWFAAGREAAGRDAASRDSPDRDAAGQAEREPARLRVVFFGLFTPLQGATVIGTALGLLADTPQVEVLMIGHGQDLAASRRAAGVEAHARWLDWVPAGELPGVEAGHDVCLGIFGTGPKALRVVPTKVFQGAAAGCAIVTSDTPPQRALLGGAALFVPPGDPAALVDALRTLASDGERLAALRAAASTLAEQRFAPEAVVAGLRTALARAADRFGAGARDR